MEKFIVLDCEGGSTVKPYNIGWIIADRNGNIFKHHNVAIPPAMVENLTSNKKKKSTTTENILTMLDDFSNNSELSNYEYLNSNECYQLLTNEITDFKIKKIYVYGTFDRAALVRLFGNRFEALNLTFRDISRGVYHTKLLTKKYVRFCLKNFYLTSKGNISYSMETVYKYLINPNFKQDHTGLNDVLAEYDILMTIFNSHKKFKWDNPVDWKKLNEIAEEVKKEKYFVRA